MSASQAGKRADSAANSKPMGWLARTGLTARALVYIVLGWLAVLVGLGGSANVDQRGALTEVLAQPYGAPMVWLLTIGFAAYALWRLSEAAFGATGEGKKAGPRLRSLARGIAYIVMAFSAQSLLHGAQATQAGQQGALAATVMQHQGGRWIVGIVGLVVVVVGLVLVREGWKATFVRQFEHLPARRRTVVVGLGRVGTIARGIVFAVTGLLAIVAAWTADPAKAGGIDQAFSTLLRQPFGTSLVVLLGAGLFVFGVYGLAEAAWRRVTD
ncbi:DUF1206 domain-containing protein [Demequina lutea]|uniref:Type IV secretory pathway TrbD component n=1 Tax=Demequina lutea TaxID=431489 RepID=A0A7Y9ZDT8_9MICO|nr:DUF1206 domain-containing protein [Demequina lutea]NYI42738.1 type IV secretory pathway TrbD component [Demequina lutea]